MRNRSKWLALKLLAVALVLAGIAVMWQNRALFQPEALRALLADHPWAPLLFVLVHVAASLLFVPRTVFSIAAGLVFGLWWGIVLTTIGAMAGAVVGFLLARYLGAGLLARFPKFEQLMARLENGGWRAVALVRLLPIMPHTPVNYAFGLTGVSLSSYCGGSFVGLLPSTLFAVDIGAAGGQALSGGWNWVGPTLVGLAALALSILLPKLRQNRA